MPPKILNGTQIASDIKDDIKAKTKQIVKSGKRPPGLAMVLVGDDPASKIYVRNKTKACKQVGFHSINKRLAADVSQQELSETIDALNADESIDGILVQLPLPDHLDASAVIERITPNKDVDGFHPYNLGRLAVRLPTLRPATPKGIMHLLSHTGVTFKGSHAVVIGASNHVGRPMGLELLLAGCTTTTIHKFSKNAKALVQNADILISATGRPGLIQGDWIKQGAIVIDVGLTRQTDGTICGDVDFDAVSTKASWITPVPGGVGPMTIASLLENTLQARALDGL